MSSAHGGDGAVYIDVPHEMGELGHLVLVFPARRVGGLVSAHRLCTCLIVERTHMGDGGHEVVELTGGVEFTKPCIFMCYPLGCANGVWVGCWCLHDGCPIPSVLWSVCVHIAYILGGDVVYCAVDLH